MLRTIAFLALVLCAGIALSTAQAANPFGGKKIYDTRCAGCHGTNGIAFMPGTPSFARGDRLMMPDRVLFASIKNGKNLCPSWRGLLSDGDILNSIAYIRTLQH